MVWLGQSTRTTVVTKVYPELAGERWLASLGDVVHRPRLAETVFRRSLKERLRVTGPVMLDSGGFTMMTRAGALGLYDVMSIYKETSADLLISLDQPPIDTDEPEARRKKYDINYRNYAALLSCFESRRVVPVLHGTSVEELAANCDAIKRLNARPAWICLGGRVPLLRQSGRIGSQAEHARRTLAETISLARERFPSSNLHVLGAGAPSTVRMSFLCGADSVDSIGWRRAAGFGTIFLPGGTERFVSARARQRPRSRRFLDDADLEMLAACACPPCSRNKALERRLALLADCYLARAAHNASVLLGEARLITAMRIAEE
jgi:queuine/archaeosine tRNA-ribosyltransferase